MASTNVAKEPPGSKVPAQDVNRVSVIIPCRNEAGRIEALLEAVRVQDVPIEEIIVADDGSTDDSAEVVSAYQQRHLNFRLRWLSMSSRGIPAAMNQAIRLAVGDVIVRLDGHSLPPPDYVRRSVATLGKTGAGVVGGVWTIVPGEANRVAEAIACAVAHPVGAGDAAYRTARKVGRGPTEVDTVPFGCFRKTTWEGLGGFNERLLANQDYEFNYRVRASGSTVVLDSDIRCTYFARSTLAGLARQYFRYGWWKAQMLKYHPRSLRGRQVLPGALVPLFVCLALAGLVWPVSAFALGGCILAYGALLLAAGLQVAGRHGRRDLICPLMAAFAVVHGLWSMGFATNIVSFGRWPRWVSSPEGIAMGQRGFGVVALLQVLTGILVLAMVLPPMLVMLINQSRIDRAEIEVSRLADVLQDSGLTDGARGWRVGDILVGPGNTPEAPGVRQWVDGRVSSLSDYVSQPLRSDPWGNRYLVNIGALGSVEADRDPRGSRALWVLSAGPNRFVETPYVGQASEAVVGDDVGARIKIVHLQN